MVGVLHLHRLHHRRVWRCHPDVTPPDHLRPMHDAHRRGHQQLDRQQRPRTELGALAKRCKLRVELCLSVIGLGPVIGLLLFLVNLMTQLLVCSWSLVSFWSAILGYWSWASYW